MKYTFLILLSLLIINISYGQVWEPVGDGLDNSVSNLTVYNNKLLVGTYRSIRYLNDSKWDSFPYYADNLLGITLPRVYTFSNTLYSVSDNTVFRFNGTDWDTLGDFKSQERPQINSLFDFKGRLIVSGDFSSVNGKTIYSLAEWDGRNWKVLGGIPTYRSFTSFAEFNDGLYATGYVQDYETQKTYSFHRYDGKKWITLDSAHPLMYAGPMINYKGNLVIGNIKKPVNGTVMKGITLWDGTEFKRMGTVELNNLNAFYIMNDELYIACTLDRSYKNVVMKWDGQDWIQIGEDFSNDVYSLCEYNNELYCTGSFISYNGNPAIRNIAKLNPNITSISKENKKASFSFYPNPARNSLSLTYIIGAPSEVSINILDLCGRIISQSNEEYKEMGSYHKDIDISDIRPGAYILKCQTSNGSSQQRFIKL